MLPRRYSVVIADPSSGVERRLQLPVRPVVAVVGAVVTLPILIGLGAAWKAKADVATLFSEYHALQLENANYRQATEALSGQIDSLQRAVTDLGTPWKSCRRWSRPGPWAATPAPRPRRRNGRMRRR
jgi:hypothetical protein